MRLLVKNLDVLLISLFVSFLIIFLAIPEYTRYDAKIINISKLENNNKIIHNDLNNDGDFEKIEINQNEGHPRIVIKSKNAIEELLTKPILRNFIFIDDINNDKEKEIAYISKSKDSIFLNVLTYNGSIRHIVKNKFITKIARNKQDAYDLSTSGINFFYDNNNDGYKEFYFLLLPEYSFHPRIMCYYDIKNKRLKKSEECGAYRLIADTVDIDNNGKIDILFASFATSNISSKFTGYKYPDTSAFFIVYNSDLEFTFKPVEFKGKTGKLITKTFTTNNSIKIIGLYTNQTQKTKQKLYLFNNKGKLIKKKDLKFKKDIYFRFLEKSHANRNFIYLYDDKGYVYKVNENLELSKPKQLENFGKTKGIKFHYFDLEGNNKNDLVYIHSSGIDFYNENLDLLAKINLEFPDFKSPHYYIKNNKRYICFTGRNQIFYTINLTKNKYYVFRHFIYLSLIVFSVFLVFIVKKIWLKKLKNDNIKLNKEIELAVKEIKTKNIQLQKNEAYKKAMTSMLVHDLKAPLQSLLSIGASTKDKYIETHSNHMHSMVMNILDVQKYQNNKMVLNISKNSLFSCCENAIKKIEILAFKKNIKIINSIPKNTNCNFDNQILERVFINLLTNSINYSDFDSYVELRRSFIKDNDSDFIQISIIDNGIGISKDLHNKIFDSYFEIQKQSYSYSTGLGLAFCKMAVLAHNGKIGVVSEENNGTEIWFKLPYEKNEIANSITNTKIHQKNLFNFNEFTKSDYKELHNITLQFKNIELYEISRLNIVLNSVNTSNPKIQKWIIQLKNAIDSANNKIFDYLINPPIK